MNLLRAHFSLLLQERSFDSQTLPLFYNEKFCGFFLLSSISWRNWVIQVSKLGLSGARKRISSASPIKSLKQNGFLVTFWAIGLTPSFPRGISRVGFVKLSSSKTRMPTFVNTQKCLAQFSSPYIAFHMPIKSFFLRYKNPCAAQLTKPSFYCLYLSIVISLKLKLTGFRSTVIAMVSVKSTFSQKAFNS